MKWLVAWKKHVGYVAPGEDPETVPKNGPAPGALYLDKLIKVCVNRDVNGLDNECVCGWLWPHHHKAGLHAHVQMHACV